MHIALCDSNPGDRKQMERLLERESDKRKSNTGVFYIDTFGSREALLNNPMIYDAYFLDVTDTEYNAYTIACSLREKGIESPIIFCISTIDYKKDNELLSNSVYLNKPIRIRELSLILDEIILQKKEHHVPKIEFRNHSETFYIEERELLYCQGSGYYIDVHLKNEKTVSATSFIENLWMELTNFPTLIMANKNTIVNARYVKSISSFHIIMDNQTVISITPHAKKILKKVMANLP